MMKIGSGTAALTAAMACAHAATGTVEYAPGVTTLSATSHIGSAHGVYDQEHEYVSSLTPHGASLATSLESLGITARASIQATHEWSDAAQRLDVAVTMAASLERTGPEVPFWEAQGSAVYLAAMLLTLTETTTLRFDAAADGERFDDQFRIGLYDYTHDVYAKEAALGAGDAWNESVTLDAGVYLLDLYGLVYELALNSRPVGGERSASFSLSVEAIPAPASALPFGLLACACARRRRPA